MRAAPRVLAHPPLAAVQVATHRVQFRMTHTTLRIAFSGSSVLKRVRNRNLRFDVLPPVARGHWDSGRLLPGAGPCGRRRAARTPARTEPKFSERLHGIVVARRMHLCAARDRWSAMPDQVRQPDLTAYPSIRFPSDPTSSSRHTRQRRPHAIRHQPISTSQRSESQLGGVLGILEPAPARIARRIISVETRRPYLKRHAGDEADPCTRITSTCWIPGWSRSRRPTPRRSSH